MNAVTAISSSASVSYATQLAQSCALKRSLSNLGTAVQKGDLMSAGSILTAFIKANPQYAITPGDGSQAKDPINQDFQALADAISNNQADTARSAWTQVQSDLTKNGVTDLGDGAAATAKLLAQTKASMQQQIVSDALGLSSGGSVSVTSLLGGASDSSNGTGLCSSLLGDWLTYQAHGRPSPLAASVNAANALNTAA